jgi:hypothetical protein
MLGIAGQLGEPDGAEALVSYALERLRTGIEADGVTGRQNIAYHRGL